MQFAVEAIGVVVGAIFSFGGTIVILKIMDRTMGLRVTEEEEDIGLDLAEHFGILMSM